VNYKKLKIPSILGLVMLLGLITLTTLPGNAFATEDDYSTPFGTVNQDATTAIKSAIGTYYFETEVTGSYVFELKGGAGAPGWGNVPGALGKGAQLTFNLELNKDDLVYITISGPTPENQTGGMVDIRINGTALTDRIATAAGGGGGGEGTAGYMNYYPNPVYVSVAGGNGGDGGKYIVIKENELETVYLDSTGEPTSVTYDNTQPIGQPGAPPSGSGTTWVGGSGRFGDGYAGGTEIIPGGYSAFYGPRAGSGGGGGFSFVDTNIISNYTHISAMNTGKASVQISMGQPKVLTYDEVLVLINDMMGGPVQTFTVLQNQQFDLRLASSTEIPSVTEGAITIIPSEISQVYELEGILATPGWNYVEVGDTGILFHVIEAPNSSNVNITFN